MIASPPRFFTYVFVLGVMVQVQWVLVQGDCWYDNKRHEENAEVPTGEPCLNCTCNRSVLLCYLRICPKLPNPPPPGCILLHRYRTCCPELICSDFYDGGNSLEARADPEGDLDMPSDDQSAYENACISNGSIYGPGSAMHSSSLCEYCYCLAGKQVCVKPKCLLPVEGCSPVFEETSCCPVRYNCTRDLLLESVTKEVTTTIASKTSEFKKQDGCLVDDIHYPEGSKVIGVGHSVCDNCYCLRGLLRCEPLSCAPPLLGCTPVVKPGECCAASYNCNGTLEIEPEPNYGLFPTISKEYSKLRKEVHRKPSTKFSHKNKDGVVTVAPFYVLAESLQEPTTKLVYQRSPDTYGTTRHFSGANLKSSSTQKSVSSSTPRSSTTPKTTLDDHYFLISSSKQRMPTERPSTTQKSVPGVYYATTNYQFQNTNYKRVYSTTSRSNIRSLPTGRVRSSSFVPPESKESNDYLGFGNLDILSIVDSLLDGKLYRKVDDAANASSERKETVQLLTNSSAANTTKVVSEDFNELSSSSSTTATPITTKVFVDASTQLDLTTSTTEVIELTTNIVDLPTAIPSDEGVIMTTTVENTGPVTVTTVTNSTDCNNGIEPNLEKGKQNIEVEITTELPIDPSEINKLAEGRTEFVTTTDFNTEDYSSEGTSTEEFTLPDISPRTNLNSNSGKLPSDIEVILNISKHKNSEDFDYDYNEPTLPPSLPNLKIIPFLAADALDAKKESPNDPSPVFIDKKIDVEPLEYSSNMFKPPIETEGGFVPKEPSVIDNFFNNDPSGTPQTREPGNQGLVLNCISQGQEILHGMSVASESPCMTCTCFYGNIVCQKSNCPPQKPGCKIAIEQGIALCCPNYICDDSIGPSLELSNIPPEIVTVAEGIIPADPFNDVIRTEPAPNLQSLIGDMISYQKIGSTTSDPSSTKETLPVASSTPKLETTTHEDDASFGLDKVLQFFFSGTPDIIEKPKSQTPSTQRNESSTPIIEVPNSSTNKIPIETTLPIRYTTSQELKLDETTASNSYVKIDLIKNGQTHQKETTFENNNNKDSLHLNSLSRLGDKTKTKILLNTNSKHQIKPNKSPEEDATQRDKNNFVGMGLLKLAGCNIYGRMYRVGRIISELSGPCLECKCTEVGVQCKQLRCSTDTSINNG